MIRLNALFALLFLALSAPARADVDVTFYSHDFGENFPHTFFTAKGELANGEVIDTNYGFTAVNVTPAILWGSVLGEIETSTPNYISKSDPHFTVTLQDAAYARLVTVVQKWRDKPQKSYSLNKRNCVHFIADAIATLGYDINADTKNWKKPKSFLREVMTLNPGLSLQPAEIAAAP